MAAPEDGLGFELSIDGRKSLKKAKHALSKLNQQYIVQNHLLGNNFQYSIYKTNYLKIECLKFIQKIFELFTAMTM